MNLIHGCEQNQPARAPGHVGKRSSACFGPLQRNGRSVGVPKMQVEAAPVATK